MQNERGADKKDVGAEVRRTIKDLPAAERPREKLLAYGPDRVTDGELLAILLRTGTGRATAIDLANRLMDKFGGLQGLAGRPPAELQKVHGIGVAKSVMLEAALELGRRIAAGYDLQRDRISGVEDVARYYRPRLRDRKTEVFLVVLLDTQNQVIREVVVSEGSLNASVVHPREIFKHAVAESAAAMILVHNHPSGDPSPSAADIELTRRVAEAGKLMDIPVHDHVIVAGNQSFSLLEAGLM